MQATCDRNALYHELHRMMDRLCSPDLTVAESKALRPQLDALLGKIQDGQGASLSTTPRAAVALAV